MKLIIAEKPSLARTIAGAVGATRQQEGSNTYYRNDEYLITFAFGHLFTLFDVDDYTGEGKQGWESVPLPFLPKEYRYKAKDDSGIKQQIKNIHELVSRADVTHIVHCGDADREGQVIIDNIINQVFAQGAPQKPVQRLWLSEQTAPTIRAALQNCKDNREYESLYREGLARAYFDWAFGVNLTRYLSIRTKGKCPVGRVLFPIVQVINDRDREIEQFTPTDYYRLESTSTMEGGEVNLTIKNPLYSMEQRGEAEDQASRLNQHRAIVQAVDQKEAIRQPPKLFSLSKLQSELSKTSGMDFATSLNHIQSLYEKGFITYPRTSTEYLAEQEARKIKQIIAALGVDELEAKEQDKKIYDNSKIESHSAITITAHLPTDLQEGESTVYNAVKRRFFAVFCAAPCKISKVSAMIRVDQQEFELKGEGVIEPGFMKYEPQTIKEEIPVLIPGQQFPVDFQPIKHTTTPPKKFTESSLAAYLKNPFHNEDTSEAQEYEAIKKGLEIGTEATRTGIIENALQYEYLTRKGQTFSITAKGRRLCDNMTQLSLDLSAQKTVEISMLLKSIYRGEIPLETGIDKVHAEIQGLIQAADNCTVELEAAQDKEPLGNCPRCGRPIFEGKNSFYCQGFRERAAQDSPPACSFILKKAHPYFTAKGKKGITSTMAKALLSKGCVKVKGLQPKDPKKNPYDATITMEDTGTFINFKMSFENAYSKSQKR